MIPDTGVPHLITLIDLAERLRVSPHTIRSWVRKDKLRPIRLCRRLLFHPHEIQRFLAEAVGKFIEENTTPARDRRHGG
jgi:predicted site-specific integrase-resolvase